MLINHHHQPLLAMPLTSLVMATPNVARSTPLPDIQANPTNYHHFTTNKT